MSLLALLGQAAIPAADAMGSYMQGEQQEQDKQNALKRQSLLDQIDQAMKQSEIRRQNAESDYYDKRGESLLGDDSVTWVKDGSGQYVALPKKVRGAGVGTGSGGMSGSSQGTASSSASEFTMKPWQLGNHIVPPEGSPPDDAEASSTPLSTLMNAPIRSGVTAPSNVKKIGVYDPSTNTIYDETTDGHRINERIASDAERAKFTAKPAPKMARSGSGYMQWNSTSGQWVPSSVAGPSPASIDPDVIALRRENEIRKRAFDLMKPSKDKFNMTKPGLDQDTAMRQAAAEYDAASAAATGGVGGGAVQPRRKGSQPAPTGSNSAEQAAAAAEQIIRSGKATLDEALSSPSLSDAAKAALRRRMSRPAPAGNIDLAKPDDET